jgi:aminopeptidase N
MFPQSPKIATNIYAVVAGPYGYFEYKNEANDQFIPPMRIYGRKSVLASVNHEEIFEVTVAGMKYYHDLFGRPYPFNKYDQVFAPESNSGGMENVGCVTYNEVRLYRG